MEAFLSLSLDFIKNFSSLFTQGEFLSHALISLVGACFYIFAENMAYHSPTILWISLVLLEVVYSQQRLKVSLNASLLKCFMLLVITSL